MVGGVIMTHGDDAGLRLPPKVAPIQVVVVVVKRDPEVTAAAEGLERELAGVGLRVRVDDRADLGLGRRLTDWELKGVPVRVEIDPRPGAGRGQHRPARRHRPRVGQPHDAAAAASCRRAVGPRGAVRPGNRGVESPGRRCRRSRRRHRSGSDRIRPSALGRLRPRRRAPLNRAGLSVRCLTTAEGLVPASADADDLYAIIARAY